MNAWLEAGLSNALVATALALLAAVVCRVVRNPKVAFVAWGLVLVKLLMPPLVAVPVVQWNQRSAEPELSAMAPIEPALPRDTETSSDADGDPVTAPPVSADAPPRSTPAAASVALSAEPDADVVEGKPLHEARPAWPVAWPSWPTLMLSTWIAGSGLWLSLATARIVSFQRLIRRARLADDRLQAEVAAIAARMGLRRAPQVRVTQAALPPLVWVWFARPTVLLPARLVEQLSHEERATLFAHELAHLARRDHLARWLELVAVGLYWWHPVAWWARRNLARAGEQCCDAAVLALLPELAQAYARTLLVATEFCCAGARPAPATASAFSRSSGLKRRMEMILSTTSPRKLSWRSRLALVVLAVVALPLSLRTAAAEAPQSARPTAAAQATPARLVSQKTAAPSIDERLTRLEQAVQELTELVKAMRNENAPPEVVKSVPERGAKDVDPSLSEIKVTFSKDMQNGSWSWTQRSDETFPEVTGEIHYEPDGRTCVLPVKLEPGKTYYLSINSARFKNFKDKTGRPAIPYPITFTTAKK